MKVKEAIKLIERDGWILSRQKGSHRQFKHPYKPGCVTIAGPLSDELDIGTQYSIFKQAQMMRRR
ncbi:MAG: type II toxin-antitoxin system HicA family toxin [Oscillospiraceae bacterium]|jgi:predicted RNA binding protein YcfA (HicA-like mRNA interferase family)|nr:type II toxin-antitoxin system HicA family toxin [Oscillospiraceae bacterium]